MSTNDSIKLGATGRFPQGKYRGDDRGELKTAISVDRERNAVFIDFGTPVTWLAMLQEEAETFALALMHAAKKARGEGNGT